MFIVDSTQVKSLAVVGAGTMGREIAQVALMADFEQVVLNDVNADVLENAKEYIRNGLKKLESKQKLKPGLTTDILFHRLKTEVNLIKATERADFVIEAIPEVMMLKQELFEKLGKITPKHAILATNTSTMSITQIGEKAGKQDKVIGMHFFIPIPLLRLIEIIRSKRTSQETVEITVAVGQKFPALKGKRVTPVIEKESPGFIVNRLTGATSIYFNWLLDKASEEGIPCERIDADVGSLQQLGPFAKWDYLGLETIYNVLTYLSEKISPDFKPGKTLSNLVKEGNLGRKTGKGIYEWVNERPKIAKCAPAGMFSTELFMAIQLNEGCRLLSEKVVSSYKIIDDTMLAGMDMPGPFGAGKNKYEKWSNILNEFAEKSGISYFKPCDMMKTGSFLKLRK